MADWWLCAHIVHHSHTFFRLSSCCRHASLWLAQLFKVQRCAAAPTWTKTAGVHGDVHIVLPPGTCRCTFTINTGLIILITPGGASLCRWNILAQVLRSPPLIFLPLFQFVEEDWNCLDLEDNVHGLLWIIHRPRCGQFNFYSVENSSQR